MAIIPVERKPLTLVERTYLPAILGGLKTTIEHLVRKKQTMEYPEQRPAIERLLRQARAASAAMTAPAPSR